MMRVVVDLEGNILAQRFEGKLTNAMATSSRAGCVGAIACALLTVAIVACAPDSADPEGNGTWVGTITTEGNVTTVVTESGSVWGGAARLVEEASIGVESGEEPYMLAGVASIAASQDRIYVLDTRPPVVRVYDMAGKHLRDIGGPGQGPGEFQGPLMSMVMTPDGKIVVRDDYSARISVFSAAGELVDTWSMPGGFRTIRESVATSDGTVYMPQVVGRDPDTRRARIAMVPYDAAGNVGEPLEEPELNHEQADSPSRNLLPLSLQQAQRVRVDLPPGSEGDQLDVWTGLSIDDPHPSHAQAPQAAQLRYQRLAGGRIAEDFVQRSTDLSLQLGM
jgi:hypothetical protein